LSLLPYCFSHVLLIVPLALLTYIRPRRRISGRTRRRGKQEGGRKEGKKGRKEGRRKDRGRMRRNEARKAARGKVRGLAEEGPIYGETLVPTDVF
jgi:hypothetical protein